MCPLGGLLKAFTRRVAEKAPLGSPQILICGESEHIRVFTVKTEF